MALSIHTAHVGSDIQVRKIGLRDLADALLEGIEDFRAKPTHLYFLAVIYPLMTLGAFMVIFNYDLVPLVFPVVSGSLLIGPFLTISMCEISRKRERGEDISKVTAGSFLKNPSARDILVLGLALLVLFFFWITTAATIYGLTLGDPWQTVAPTSIGGFLSQLVTTPEGWAMMLIGNTVGLFFAVTALCLAVVSFPLLLDRPVGTAVAVQASIRAVFTNPVMLAIWGMLVVAALVIGAVPFLVGLAVCVPVLGHATWHLYRKLIV